MSVLAILAATIAASQNRLVALRPNVTFPEAGQETVVVYPDIDPKVPFDEVIASWNVGPATNASVKVDLRASGEGYTTKWYRMGEWSLDHDTSPRISVDNQKDENGNVLTDTLRLKNPGQKVDLQLTLRNLAPGPKPVLNLLTLAFSNGKGEANDVPVRSDAWGKTVEVPKLAQGDYPRGSVLCSPTSVSMLLSHWSNQLGRPELNQDVPEVEARVWDKVYDGAGNWPFNTAYMGSFPGIRSYVARFNSIADLEKWTSAGLPLACSVSFDLLRGKPQSPNDSGHLVVIVGFTSEGDPVFNDPARRGQVRMIYKRADFEKAWLNSRRTVYIVHPASVKAPAGSNGLWIEE